MYLSILEFKFLIEFVYSDLLNENTLTNIIEEKKQTNSNEIIESVDMKDASDEKWLLTINNLVRLCIQFKLERLEKSLKFL